MSNEEIDLLDDIALFVSLSAHERHSWLSQLRPPTEDEERLERLFIQRFPTRDQAIEQTPTKVIRL
jgi:hypothetical protein